MMNRQLNHTSVTEDADPVDALVYGLTKLTLPNSRLINIGHEASGTTDSEIIKERTDRNRPALQPDDRGKDQRHLRHTQTDPHPRPKADQDHRGKKHDDPSSHPGRINANRDLNAKSDRPVRDLSVLSSKYTGHPHRNRHSKDKAEYNDKSAGFGWYSTDRDRPASSGRGNLAPVKKGFWKAESDRDPQNNPHRRREFTNARPRGAQQAVSNPRMWGGRHQPRGPTVSDRRFEDSKLEKTEDGYLFDPSDYPENERHDQFLQFLVKCAPSKTKRRSDGIGRIVVNSPSFVHEQQDAQGLEDAWKRLTDSTNTIDFSDVKGLAVSYGFLRGIWLLFVETGTIDKTWEKIASATVNGELGTYAKVTPFDDRPEQLEIYGSIHQVISVYTKNFTDYGDVIAIERKIRSLDIDQPKLIFKPGVYATLGLYSGNRYGLKPGIYVSEWNAERNVSKIRSNVND